MDSDYQDFLRSLSFNRCTEYNEGDTVMQSEPSEVRPRMYRCYCRRRRESNPLFRAVLSNDLDELITLVEAGNSINILNAKGSSLLNFIMRRKRVEIFNYLLSKNDIDVNILDRLEQSPLLYLAGVCFDEYFALELIKKGADIHQTDDLGFTFLHLAAKSDDDNLRVGQLIIEKGADLNSQAKYGVTPLYSACEVGNIDWIYMLLYYSADVTIGSDRGVLPLAVISEDLPDNLKFQLEEILFNYTFDDYVTTVRLPTLVAAMTQRSLLFSRILHHVTDVDYNTLDLQHFVTSLVHVNAKHLQLFLNKFGYIIEDLIQTYPILDILVQMDFDCGVQGLKEILNVFLNSEYVADFVQFSSSTISQLFKVFSYQESVSEKEFTEIVCLMLTYGLNVTSRDLDMVYNTYGYCELFKILLHMDVVLIEQEVSSMAALYYDPRITINDFIVLPELCENLLDYYNQRWLKLFFSCRSVNNSELLQKVEKLPKVPLLVELSRDVARRYIVDRFNIVSSVHFNTVLQWLPIGKMNKMILALEQKLY